MSGAAQFRPHQVVRVKAGKYSGLVGTVQSVAGERVHVAVAGVVDGKPLDVRTWFKPSTLEVL